MQNKQMETLLLWVAVMGVITAGSVLVVSAYEEISDSKWGFAINRIKPTYSASDSVMLTSLGKEINVKIADEKTIVASIPNFYRQSNMSDLKKLNYFENEGEKSNSLPDYSEHNIDIPLQNIVAERDRIEAEQEQIRQIELQKQREQELKDNEVGIQKEVPNTRNEFKSWMDYRTITSKSSPQYKLQHDENTTTNEEGFRVHNGEYIVAVGSYYTREIGTRLRVTLASGKVFYAVVGDAKSDAHTDAKHQHRNGNVIEFIVDTDKIPDMCKKMGNMSFAENAGLEGKIQSIEVLSKVSEEALS